MALLLLPDLFGLFPSNLFKEKLLQADTAYLKVDYTGVIDELEEVWAVFQWHRNVELATSYLQGLNFFRGPKEGHPQQRHA